MTRVRGMAPWAPRSKTLLEIEEGVAHKSDLPDFPIESRHHANAPALPKQPGAWHQEANPDATPTLLTLAHAARVLRQAVKDKSYRAFPLGQEAGYYLRAKRKRLTTESYRDYESCLDKLARYFADLNLEDFEPPIGTERLEEFLDFQWGSRAGRTYNKNLSILRDFFKFHVLRKRLHGDPTLPIERAKKRAVYRTTFSVDERNAILAANSELRDKLALRSSTTDCGRARCKGSSSSISTTIGNA